MKHVERKMTRSKVQEQHYTIFSIASTRKLILSTRRNLSAFHKDRMTTNTLYACKAFMGFDLPPPSPWAKRH
jgi:hypothetical protein